MSYTQTSKEIQKAILQPVLSPDHEFLAILNADQTIRILSLRTGTIASHTHFPRTIKPFLTDVRFLRWSPEVVSSIDSEKLDSSRQTLKKWILIAGSSRIVTFSVDLPTNKDSSLTPISHNANVLADYEFESHYGRIAMAEFAFTHKQALVTFEMNTHASLISFTELRRDDIASPKFANAKGFAQSNDNRCFALLRRTKGQDMVTVFSCRDGIAENTSTFALGTIDAQGMRWSPNKDPVLCVWDSQAFQPTLFFFTALGHPLSQLNLDARTLASDGPQLGIYETGISCLSWKQLNDDRTLLATGFGESRLLLRSQNNIALTPSPSNICQYPSILDGTQCNVWQQTKSGNFEQQNAIFETQPEPGSEIDMIEINASIDAIATRMNTSPNTVWIWDAHNTQLKAMLCFQNDVKKVLWHPSAEDVLAILTSEKKGGIYIHRNNHTPEKVVLPAPDMVAESRWNATWVSVIGQKRCPLLVSNARQFALGLVSDTGEQLVLETILRDDLSLSEFDEETSLFETPSKQPNRAYPSSNPHLDHTSVLWDVTTSDIDW